MTDQKPETNTEKDKKTAQKNKEEKQVDENKSETKTDMPEEIGGPEGPEPTRYGDWEVGGRCTDF